MPLRVLLREDESINEVTTTVVRKSRRVLIIDTGAASGYAVEYWRRLAIEGAIERCLIAI